MTYYLIRLNNGGALLAKDYHDISSTEYRVEAIAKKGEYTYDVLKQDVLDIEEITHERLNKIINNEK